MQNSKLTILSVILLLLAIYAVATCLQIELLNHKVGNYLPRTDLVGGGNHRWVTSPVTEKVWRSWFRRDTNGVIDESPLNPDEQAGMQQFVQNGRNMNKLHGLIGSRGLLQYPICILIFTFSILVWRYSKQIFIRVFASTAIGIGFACLALAIYRGYFESLAW